MGEDSRKSPSGNNNQPFDPQKAAEKTGHWRPRVLIHKPGEDPAALDEAKRNTSIIAAAKTIQPEDFTHVHKLPCVRDALLPAIGCGTGAGVVRFIIGGAVMTASNWAVGTFTLISCGMYAFCQRQRRIDKQGIAQVVKVLDQKEAMKDVTRRVQEVEAKGKNSTEVSGTVKSKVSTKDAKLPTTFWSSFKFW